MEQKFSSFEEIDTRLQTLRMQRELSRQRLSGIFGRSPGELLREGIQGVGPAIRNHALEWMLHRLRQLRRKIRPELPELP